MMLSAQVVEVDRVAIHEIHYPYARSLVDELLNRMLLCPSNFEHCALSATLFGILSNNDKALSTLQTVKRDSSMRITRRRM
jgi:hypothetical protein